MTGTSADLSQQSAVHRAALPFALLLTGVALLLSTFGTDYADLGGAFSPTFFPRIVLFAWIGLATLATLVEVIKGDDVGDARFGAVVIVSLALLGYVQLLPVLGYFLCSAAFAMVLLLATGLRKPVPLLVFSLALPAALVALFNHVLVMPLPVSPFVWWL